LHDKQLIVINGDVNRKEEMEKPKIFRQFIHFDAFTIV